MTTTHPNTTDETWPAKFGHPPSYFDNLLAIAEREAYQFGVEMGVSLGAIASLLTFGASKLSPETLHSHGFSHKFLGPSFRGFRTYHITLFGLLTGLVGSQMATHYHFQMAHDRITEQRRREAFFRAEARRKGEF